MDSHEGVETAIATFRRLAEVDPARFARLLAIAAGIVGAHDGYACEQSSDVHGALMSAARGRSFQA